MSRPAPRRTEAGFTMVSVLVASVIGAMTIAAIGSGLVALARAQARLLLASEVADQLALAVVAIIAAPTAPTISGTAVVHPPIVALPDCTLEATNTSQLPHAVELQASCTRGGQQHQATRWATWEAPAPTPPTP